MTLHLYLLRQLLISFCFSLGGISLLVLPTMAVQAVHKLGGVSMLAVLRYLPLVVGELVPYLLPMALCFFAREALGSLLRWPLFLLALVFAEVFTNAVVVYPQWTLNGTTVHRSVIVLAVVSSLLLSAICCFEPGRPRRPPRALEGPGSRGRPGRVAGSPRLALRNHSTRTPRV